MNETNKRKIRLSVANYKGGLDVFNIFVLDHESLEGESILDRLDLSMDCVEYIKTKIDQIVGLFHPDTDISMTFRYNSDDRIVFTGVTALDLVGNNSIRLQPDNDETIFISHPSMVMVEFDVFDSEDKFTIKVKDTFDNIYEAVFDESSYSDDGFLVDKVLRDILVYPTIIKYDGVFIDSHAIDLETDKIDTNKNVDDMNNKEEDRDEYKEGKNESDEVDKI